jgi:hypothetical protein
VFDFLLADLQKKNEPLFENIMEPDVQEFLIRIIQTISMAIVWLLVNMCALGNYIFYGWFLLSSVWIISYLRKKWKGWKEMGE